MFIKLSRNLLPVLALSLAAGCVDQPGTDDTFVFGLSAEEVLAAKAVAHTTMTDAAWLDAHRGEFDCSHYGDLCRVVGQDRAYQVIETGYLLALDGADRAAIRAAQDQALERAFAEVDAEPEAASPLFGTNISYFYGGSGNKRLKVVARAELMWPSLELRSSGYCAFQKDSFGWWAATADRIDGTLTATFNGSTVFVQNRAANNTSRIDFGPIQLDAVNLTTRIQCSAAEDVWDASGSQSVSESS